MENENPALEAPVGTTTGLQELVVNYIGERLEADEIITVDMAVQVFAAEFPEFLMAVAEENFLRGYEQALIDVEQAEKEKFTEKEFLG
jgi:hypothetical protein|tara:strand:- start:3527 stop:3790 length:264 start_codon:yes stop_codon:yes gene_type:complete